MSPPDSRHSGITWTQVLLVSFITLFWGVNWPVMKMAVTHYPPMTFRLASAILGIAAMYSCFKWAKISLFVPKEEWALVLRLGLLNMVVWHVVLMIALPHLNSGRSSVIGFTMPVFSAVWGVMLYRQHITRSQITCLVLGFIGVALLISSEFSSITGNLPMALLLLGATSVWALGAQQLRRARTDLSILTISFWMTVITAVAITPFSIVQEMDQWAVPSLQVSLAILFNAVIIFGFCHTAWAVLARQLSPVVSSVSISLIPVIGLLSGAYFLDEQLHWQDAAAIALITCAVLGTITPSRKSGIRHA